MRARDLIGPHDAAVGNRVDETLTEVFALSGQVERAIDMGEMLLARLGPGPVSTGRPSCTWGSRGRRSWARAGRRRLRASR